MLAVLQQLLGADRNSTVREMKTTCVSAQRVKGPCTAKQRRGHCWGARDAP